MRYSGAGARNASVDVGDVGGPNIRDVDVGDVDVRDVHILNVGVAARVAGHPGLTRPKREPAHSAPDSKTE